MARAKDVYDARHWTPGDPPAPAPTPGPAPNYTPGPYRVEPWQYATRGEVLTIQTSTDAIAQLCDLWPPDEREAEKQANGRLLAAAPGMADYIRMYAPVTHAADCPATAVYTIDRGPCNCGCGEARALLARIDGQEG